MVAVTSGVLRMTRSANAVSSRNCFSRRMSENTSNCGRTCHAPSQTRLLSRRDSRVGLALQRTLRNTANENRLAVLPKPRFGRPPPLVAPPFPFPQSPRSREGRRAIARRASRRVTRASVRPSSPRCGSTTEIATRSESNERWAWARARLWQYCQSALLSAVLRTVRAAHAPTSHRYASAFAQRTLGARRATLLATPRGQSQSLPRRSPTNS
jgi:hypothetical protein